MDHFVALDSQERRSGILFVSASAKTFINPVNRRGKSERLTFGPAKFCKTEID